MYDEYSYDRRDRGRYEQPPPARRRAPPPEEFEAEEEDFEVAPVPPRAVVRAHHLLLHQLNHRGLNHKDNQTKSRKEYLTW